MMRSPRWSFRLRLGLAMALVAGLSILATGLLALRLAEAALTELATRRNEALLASVQANLDLYISNRIYRLELLASTPEMQSLEPGRMGPAMRQFLAATTFYRELFVHATGGRLLAVEPAGASDTAARAAVFPEGAVAAPALSAGPHPFVTEAPGPGARAGAGTVHVHAVPVRRFVEPEQAAGYLSGTAELDGSGVQDILDSYRLPGATYVAVLDAEGELLARAGAGLARDARRMRLPADLVAAAAAGQGPFSREAFDGPRADLLSLAFSRRLGAWLTVGQPRAEAFALIGALRENLAVAALLAVALAALAGLGLARTLAWPVLALAGGIDRLKEGVLSHRLDELPGEELGRAGRSFNALAEMLQKRVLIGSLWDGLSRRRRNGGEADGADRAG